MSEELFFGRTQQVLPPGRASGRFFRHGSIVEHSLTAAATTTRESSLHADPWEEVKNCHCNKRLS